MKKKAHPGFKAVQKQIAKKQGVGMERAGAILAAGSGTKASNRHGWRAARVAPAGLPGHRPFTTLGMNSPYRRLTHNLRYARPLFTVMQEAHPGFKAGKKAVAANPRLKKVSGVKKGK